MQDDANAILLFRSFEFTQNAIGPLASSCRANSLFHRSASNCEFPGDDLSRNSYLERVT